MAWVQKRSCAAGSLTLSRTAMPLHAAAQLADMVVGQADGVLPEGQLLVALVGEQADIEVLLGELHGSILAQIQNIQMLPGLRPDSAARRAAGEGVGRWGFAARKMWE